MTRLAAIALLTLLFSAAFSAQAAENRYGVAVIIGNKTYEGDIPSVSFAHNDADAFRRYVRESLKFRDGNIIDLRDASEGKLRSVFGSVGSHRGLAYRFVRPGKSDLVVFYSGHGVPGLKDRRGYLLPVDANPATAEINGYPLDLLYSNLAKVGARSVTIYIDACFSGNSNAGMLIRAASPLFIRVMEPKIKAEMSVVTAASGDQVASWDEEAGMGLFTRHLLQGLAGRADQKEWGNGDGNVTLAELKSFLDDEMTYAARRRFNREQTASVYGSNTRIMARYDVAPKPAAQKPQASPPAVAKQAAVVVPKPAAPAAPADTAAAGECDRLALNPLDKSDRGSGVHFGAIDAVKAIAACQRAAATDPRASRFIYQLARAFDAGGRFDDARRAYEKAIEAGSRRALVNLGVYYRSGKGGAVDHAKAIGYFDRAARDGDAAAIAHLGVMYEDGLGLTQDEDLAFEYYQKAAQAGSGFGQYRLARMYQRGISVWRNENEALWWYRQAAEQGNPLGEAALALMYLKGEAGVDGRTKAFALNQRAAARGWHVASANLAWAYEHGVGVDKDQMKAIEYYRRAAAQAAVHRDRKAGVWAQKQLLRLSAD